MELQNWGPGKLLSTSMFCYGRQVSNFVTLNELNLNLEFQQTKDMLVDVDSCACVSSHVWLTVNRIDTTAVLLYYQLDYEGLFCFNLL